MCIVKKYYKIPNKTKQIFHSISVGGGKRGAYSENGKFGFNLRF